MPPKQTTPAAPGSSTGSGPAQAAAGPARPPVRGIAPSRGAAFLAGVGRGTGMAAIPSAQPAGSAASLPVNRPTGPHFAPKRIVRAAPSPSPGPSSAGATGTPPPAGGPGPHAPPAAGRGGAARGARGGARGGGPGRGGAVMSGPRGPVEMTASGPFALGTGAIRAQKKVTTLAPILNPSGSKTGPGPSSGGPPRIGGTSGTGTSAPTESKTGTQPASTAATDGASSASGSNAFQDDTVPMSIQTLRYSSEGLQIIDMQDVPHMDERAPAAIPRRDVQKTQKKRKPKRSAVKLEVGASSMDQDGDDADAEDDAMDLSESEHEEEEPDHLAADFMPVNGVSPEDRLYLLQIPRPFPSFIVDPNYVPPPPKVAVKPEPGTEGAALASGDSMEGVQVSTSSAIPEVETDTKITPGKGIQIPVRGEFSSSNSGAQSNTFTAQDGSASASGSSKPKRSVSFAPDTVGGPGSARDALEILDDDDEPKAGNKMWHGNPEGQVGEILIWRDGSVKLLLGNIIMNVSAALQHTFLQQIMALDDVEKKAYTLGEVQRKFIATPDIDVTLADYEQLRREEDEEEARLREEEERKRAEEDRIAAEAAARRKERAAAGASAASSGKGSHSRKGASSSTKR